MYSMLRTAVPALARVVHGADVRVVKGRSNPPLAAEPVEPNGVLRPFGRQKLQRDGPVEAQLTSLVNHSHAAAPE